ncbi:MAG: glutathione peroxidase [Clostridium sp.]|nr:glutathione peroxidase [Clostridium sp.]
MSIYDYSAEDIDGKIVPMDEYKGKVMLIVNTASKCGFTPQYTGLEKLYEDFKEQDFVVLGFPSNQFKEQEPGSDNDIKSFCEINYGVTFPLFSKVDVNGEDAHDLFKCIRKETKGLLGDSVKWNFTKFLVDRNGQVFKRFAPQTSPDKLVDDIKKLL